MKQVLLSIAAMSTLALTSQAFAQPVSCPGGTTRLQTVIIAVRGNTMCAAAAIGGDRWQEFHMGASGGDLIDWKLGASTMDPTEKVGTWSAVDGADSTLTHNYLGGSSFSWLMCTNGAAIPTYTLMSLSGAATITGVKMLAGQVPCPP